MDNATVIHREGKAYLRFDDGYEQPYDPADLQEFTNLENQLLDSPQLMDAFMQSYPRMTLDDQGRGIWTREPRFSLNEIKSMGDAIGDRNRVSSEMARGLLDLGVVRGAPELIMTNSFLPYSGVPQAAEDLRLAAGDAYTAVKEGRYGAAVGNTALAGLLALPAIGPAARHIRKFMGRRFVEPTGQLGTVPTARIAKELDHDFLHLRNLSAPAGSLGLLSRGYPLEQY